MARKDKGAEYDGDISCISAETADYCMFAEQENGGWHWQLERWDAWAGIARPVAQGVAPDEEAAKRQMAAIVRRAGFRAV